VIHSTFVGMKKLRDIVHYSSTVSDILVVCLVSLRTKNSILSISPLIIITEGSSTVQKKKVFTIHVDKGTQGYMYSGQRFEIFARIDRLVY
jgi:hypothetical protein